MLGHNWEWQRINTIRYRELDFKDVSEKSGLENRDPSMFSNVQNISNS